MYTCMECYTMYDNHFMLRHVSEFGMSDEPYVVTYCPKVNCHGEVVEIDDLIAPTIVTLNEKGYLTKFCCSGHWYEDYLSLYISFYYDCVDEDSFKDLPSGFYLDKGNFDGENPFICIRANQDNFNGLEPKKLKIVNRLNEELLEWALSLPENECIY